MTTPNLSTQLDPKLAKQYFSQLKSSIDVDLHLSISEEFMKVILSDDNLEVRREEEVSEMLMNWLQVQTEAGHEVHPDQLLPLIRWSGISVDYVKSKLLQNKILTSNSSSISFLSKVTTFLHSGAQFEGLLTFHRPSTGLENCLVVVGLDDGGNNIYNEIQSINLQYQSNVKTLTSIPTKINRGAVACLLNNDMYITGIGDQVCHETWTWNVSPGWRRCADMLTGRVYHGAAAVDTKMYVFGGWIYTDETTLTTVECYNAITNQWSEASQLIHAVCVSSCVTYNNSIYVFGGKDENEHPVSLLQVYNPAQESCTLMVQHVPNADSHTRAVLWEKSVILLSRDNCFIYNFEMETWQERKQFKTGVCYIATTIANSTLYVAGGAIHWMEMDEEFICTDEIKSVSVLDIIQDKPAVWKHHAKLTKSVLIHSFVNTSLVM